MCDLKCQIKLLEEQFKTVGINLFKCLGWCMFFSLTVISLLGSRGGCCIREKAGYTPGRVASQYLAQEYSSVHILSALGT